jgi:hypothetical protein
LDDHEVSSDLLLAPPDEIQEGTRKRLPSCGLKAYEDNARTWSLARIDQLPEVFVLGQDYAAPLERTLHNLPIREARGDLGDRDDIEPCCPKGTYYPEVAALIGKKLHELKRRACGPAA